MDGPRFNLNLPAMPPSRTILYPRVNVCPIKENDEPCNEPLNPTWPSVTIKGHDAQGRPYMVNGYRACWRHLKLMGLVS